jgi:hypothetical protein
MWMLVFNWLGLLASVLCGVGAAFLIGGLEKIGVRLSVSGEFISWLIVWTQASAIIGLSWDRSDQPRFFKAYWRHFIHIVNSVFPPPRPKNSSYNPAQRVLFCGFPLAIYPFVMLAFLIVSLVYLAAVSWSPSKEHWFNIMLPATAASCAVTLLYAYLTRHRRLIDSIY